jgi:anaerobic magnesium-protoporphyrin IX monomethyl ester cyclase
MSTMSQRNIKMNCGLRKLPVDPRNDRTSRVLLVSLPGLNTGNEPIFPLGIGYLLAAIRQDRPAQAVHYQVFEHATRQVPEIISVFQPEIVGLTCSTFNRDNVRKICAWLRKLHPQIKIILGGVHVSYLTEQALCEYGADCVVIGEGDLTFRELCNALDKDIPLACVKGIAYRDGEQIVTTKPREVVYNLDDLPLPDYSYAGDLMKRSGMGFVITSRGCPVRCHFCSTGSYWGQRVRVNSPRRVVDEMEALIQNYGVRKIFFHDDTFNLGTTRVGEICDEISARGLNVEWGVSCRVHPVSQEMIDSMVAAGCRHICWGIESGSVQMLARINKKITQVQISQAYELCRKHLGKITVGAFTLVGNPGESEETIAESARFINTLPLTDPPSTAILCILPGTQLYNDVKVKHPEIERFWAENDGVPQYTLEHPVDRLEQWSNVISQSGKLVSFDRNRHFWNNVLFGNIPAPSVPVLSFLGLRSQLRQLLSQLAAEFSQKWECIRTIRRRRGSREISIGDFL